MTTFRKSRASADAGGWKSVWLPRLAAGSLSVAFVVLMGRVVQLQVAPSADLKEHMRPRVTTVAEPPIRGDVCDRRGRPLSVTRFGYRLCVDPLIMAEYAQPIDDAIVKLAVATGEDRDAIGMALQAAIARNNEILAEQGAKPEPAGLSRWLSRVLGREIATVDLKPAVFGSVSLPRADSTATSARITGGEADASKLGTAELEPANVDLASIEPIAAEPVSPGEQTGATVTATEAAAAPAKPSRPKRYLPLTSVLTDDQVAAVRSLKLKGVVLERVPVREYPGGAPAASLVGLVGFEQNGLMGAERLLDSQLRGRDGRIGFYRDRAGKPLWIEPGQVRPSLSGRDVRLSIDLELQRIATEELTRGVEEAYAAGGRLVVLDPLSGEVLAMVDIVRRIPEAVPYPWVDAPKRPIRRGEKPPPEPRVLDGYRRYIVIDHDANRDEFPALARNRCIEDVYEPGSTFKPFVWATVTELGLAAPSEVFNTHGGRWKTYYGRYVEDVTKRSTMNWAEVLINSSNIGMIKAAERMSYQQLHDTATRFGFGRQTGISVNGRPWAGEASGLVTSMKAWSRYSQTSVAYGHEIAVTPVQMARAFSSFCRDGDLAGTLPALHLTAVEPVTRADGQSVRDTDFQAGIIYRVLPPSIAVLTRETLKGVATNMESKYAKPPPGGWRYSMFGKSGTAEIPLGKAPEGKKRPQGSSGYYDDQYNSSFIAGAPLEKPRLVALVVIDDPGPERVFAKPLPTHYGAATAGPVARRVLERSLTYLGVTPSPPPADATPPTTPMSARPAPQATVPAPAGGDSKPTTRPRSR